MDYHTYTRLVFRHCMDTSGGQPAVPEVCSQTGRRHFPLQRSPTQLNAALIEPATSKSPYFIGAEELMNTFLTTTPGGEQGISRRCSGSGRPAAVAAQLSTTLWLSHLCCLWLINPLWTNIHQGEKKSFRISAFSEMLYSETKAFLVPPVHLPCLMNNWVFLLPI